MPPDDQQACAEMPRYKCHKEVHALKIKEIRQSPTNPAGPSFPAGSWDIVPEDNGFAPFAVAHEWYIKHSPKAGGYYVVYADGYASFSPAKAFEDGYTLVSS